MGIFDIVLGFFSSHLISVLGFFSWDLFSALGFFFLGTYLVLGNFNQVLRSNWEFCGIFLLENLAPLGRGSDKTHGNERLDCAEKRKIFWLPG